MKEGFLLTCPDYDTVTKAFFDYTKEIKEFAFEKGLRFVSLDADKANSVLFRKSLIKLNPSFVFLNGHGNDSQVFGNNDELILSLNKNFEIFGKRICYCRSCSSAKILGKKLVKGGGSFIGYEEPFKFQLSEKNAHVPMRDKIGKLFLEPSNLIPHTILKGKTTLEAHERGKKATLKNINKVLQNHSISLQVAVNLWHNYNAQTLQGRGDLTINSNF